MTRFVLADAAQPVEETYAAYATYDEAQAARVATLAGYPPGVVQPLLLDLDSVDVTNAAELWRLVDTVPLLHAIFTYGRNVQLDEEYDRNLHGMVDPD